MRALLAAAAVLPALALGGPAHASYSSCSSAGDGTLTRIADLDTAVGPVAVTVSHPRGTWTYVCVETPVTSWTVAVRVGTSSELPLHAAATLGECPLTLLDAGGFHLSVGATARPSVCLSQGTWATTYTLGPPFGTGGFADVEVWRDGERVL